jgi:hypothetical protein
VDKGGVTFGAVHEQGARTVALEAVVAGSQIELVDKHLDHTNRIVFAHIVIQTPRQKRELCSILAFDESLHDNALQNVLPQYRW